VKPVLGNRVLPVFCYAVFLSQFLALAMSGCSSNSYNPPPDTTPPSAPTGLTATAVSTSQINLSWTASTDNVGVTGYKVERCQGAACSSFVQVATPTTTTFSDTGLTGSTSYSYRVRATDAAGNLSTFSNTSSATTTTGPISVSITPVRGGATVSQSVNFTARTMPAPPESHGQLPAELSVVRGKLPRRLSLQTPQATSPSQPQALPT